MAWDQVKFRLSHLAIAPSNRLGVVPSSDSRHPLRARSGNVRARRALVNIRRPAISSARSV